MTSLPGTSGAGPFGGTNVGSCSFPLAAGLLAAPLEPRWVERVTRLDARLNVISRPELLGQPRYPGDHFPPIRRTPEQAEEWSRLVGQAEVMLDVDQPSAAEIVKLAPRLRWI